MGLFDYDYEELAQRAQSRLDRLTVDFLRGHGARVRLDEVDFHGDEHIELELSHGGHRLSVRQHGPATGLDPSSALPLGVFESAFDGRPTARVPLHTIAEWLKGLPAGEAPAERRAKRFDADNPFAARLGGARSDDAPPANPFLPPAQQRDEPNPFGSSDAEARRKKALDWLGGDD